MRKAIVIAFLRRWFIRRRLAKELFAREMEYHYLDFVHKTPKRTSILSGPLWVDELHLFAAMGLGSLLSSMEQGMVLALRRHGLSIRAIAVEISRSTKAVRTFLKDRSSMEQGLKEERQAISSDGSTVCLIVRHPRQAYQLEALRLVSIWMPLFEHANGVSSKPPTSAM
ncbi:hypothetical protein H257_10465 [Aphanomyces astaci]|uniref:Tc3 transposase DNA binding domain-containing protein n=1 Tax=Aphanomyces astaci TaxID=112090 RepID=W4G6E5_APHAT|nr:hypothetical protein H257_10465 [Aphanomyces astaci]ETV75282.1 hypothetical protein H257_10465 [Aphanomyces astaci]|eukprot:XP_009835330.1 hypothetical protein H257_10465 [Aphanomyces astaci]